MLNRLADMAILLGLIALVWVFATRAGFVFSSDACWTSC